MGTKSGDGHLQVCVADNGFRSSLGYFYVSTVQTIIEQIFSVKKKNLRADFDSCFLYFLIFLTWTEIFVSCIPQCNISWAQGSECIMCHPNPPSSICTLRLPSDGPNVPISWSHLKPWSHSSLPGGIWGAGVCTQRSIYACHFAYKETR